MCKLTELLEMPFEDYMSACWEHVAKLAASDPAANVVYQEILEIPSIIEAAWARRYWFYKNEVYDHNT